METGALQAVVKYTGLGGVAILVLWFVYRAVIGKAPVLSRPQGFSVLRWVIVLTFLAVLAAMGAYVYIAKPDEKAARLIYRGAVSAAADKQPIKDAKAEILGHEDIAARLSNEQGFFTLELPATSGKFEGTVRVRHPDFEPVIRTIKLSSETTDELFVLAWPEREWGGDVREADGKLAADVAVTLDSSPPTTVRTNSEGRFNLKVRAQPQASLGLRVELGGKVVWNYPQTPSQHIQIILQRRGSKE